MNRRKLFGSLIAGFTGLLLPWKAKAKEEAKPEIVGWVVKYIFNGQRHCRIFGPEDGVFTSFTECSVTCEYGKNAAKEYTEAVKRIGIFQNVEMFPVVQQW